MNTAASCRLLAALLAPDEYDVRTVEGGADALRLIRADPPDLMKSASEAFTIGKS